MRRTFPARFFVSFRTRHPKNDIAGKERKNHDSEKTDQKSNAITVSDRTRPGLFCVFAKNASAITSRDTGKPGRVLSRVHDGRRMQCSCSPRRWYWKHSNWLIFALFSR